MDTAFGALIGAVVGSLATGGTTLVSGWFQREGVRVAARVEHQKERRQGRQDSYREFLKITNDLSAIARHQNYINRTGEELDPDIMGGAYLSLEEAWIDVSLYGPRDATLSAMGVMEAAQRLKVGAAMSAEGMDPENSFINDIRNFGSVVGEFMVAAQKALDDDGSRRLRKWPARR
ncbi:hypothetical protein ACFVUY_15660 [Kitasatospora sp. NPDC058063]|uniref:hypothetical protein n=1 Tax=unclassified Kitasatospora TaxID=2633591 RepID=UPI0036DF4DA5